MNKTQNISEILKKLNIQFNTVGINLEFNGFSSFFDQKPKSCTWIKEINSSNFEILKSNVASLFIVSETPFYKDKLKTFVIVTNPKEVFFNVIRSIYRKKPLSKTFIHPTAIISPKAKIGDNVYIGEHCIIGECKIGNFTKIESFTKIHNYVVIGDNVDIHEYCNIGGIGFGHLWEDKKYENLPHIGSVSIEDFVEIFPYTNIDRAMLGPTRIGKGTIIDHYCHIGHNSDLDENNMIMCNSTSLGGVNLVLKM